ncbi:MAG: peptide chain release factor N(5)-glutamine methyltransferase [Acidobacteriota bacterium]
MTSSSTIALALQQANAFLREHDVPEAQLVAQSLLASALNCDRTYLIINFRQNLTSDEQERYTGLLARRATGEPLQYITGTQEFFGLEFEVNRDVLIPRPETELIVEEVIRLSTDIDSPLIIDVGTGSGCLAVALARELTEAHVLACDISTAALAVAHRNARRHQADERVSFFASDLLSALKDAPFADFIVSNPPYIATDEMATLQREVRDWEPASALTDFGDGLRFFKRLFVEAPGRLKPGGRLLCEMGYQQSASIRALVDAEVWGNVSVIPDLQGIPRCMVLELSPAARGL